MLKFAELIQKELNKHNGLYNGPVASLTKTDRYVMYKCGPVLSVNVCTATFFYYYRKYLPP